MIYKEFWDLFIKGYGAIRVSILMFSVTVVVSVLEGVNAGLLVPLLETLQSSDGEQDHWISRAFESIFNAFGLTSSLGTILIALGIIVLVLAGLKYLKQYLVSKVGIGFAAWMRSQTMENLLQADVAYFHREKVGELADGLTTQANRASASFFYVTEILTAGGMVAAYLIAAFMIAPDLTAIAFAMLAVTTLVIQYHVKKAGSIGARLVERNKELHSAALENLTGIRVIKSFVLEPFRKRDFENMAAAIGTEEHNLTMNQSQGMILQETFMFGLIGAIVYVGVAVLGLEMAVVVSLLFILYRMSPRVTQINARRQQMAAATGFLTGIRKTIEETSQPDITSGNNTSAKLTQAIDLRNVDFSYEGGPPVLSDASFTIARGKMTAIVGSSGAGKSTLLDLLLRYHDPVSGNILVDGINLKEFDLKTWRKSIGVVSQDVFLFHDTIGNNITLGREDYAEQTMEEAAKQAYAHDFILGLPDGYDTIVGDRGWNLSGGQRQRVALARAILSKPEILILDEATSSLDSESEQPIQEYIKRIRGTCTIIVVAHRLSTIQDADKIAVLDNGKIVEEGDWDSLLDEAGVFANYHRLQTSGS